VNRRDGRPGSKIHPHAPSVDRIAGVRSGSHISTRPYREVPDGSAVRDLRP
jgi:hypothetical protein